MINFNTLPEPILSQTAKTVLEKRYLKKDAQGIVVETPKELFFRVASHVAKADEKIYDTELSTMQFYNEMTELRFLPNTPTLINAGRPLGMLSACFVLPIGDSMEHIFTTLRDDAMIFKCGGGVGHSFSKLRPSGDMVSSTVGVSSGPIAFMKAYNATIEAIKQGGVRRGAAMGILRVDHPDILAFIKCKDDPKELNNFNISVAVTDEFMKAVKHGKEYDIVNPKLGEKVGKLKAKDVFNLIVEQAHKNGEPGIIFIDTINRHNPTPSLGEIESTNPCGEQPLLPYESCNLASINLAKFVTNKRKVDYGSLKETVKIATHFLDNVIDINKYPLPIIADLTKANRKIGLGVMGWADMLVQMNVPYDSKEALELAEKVIEFIQTTGLEMSRQLAKDKGPFPNFGISIYHTDKVPRRNATITTIAPTGTISMIADASSGIEPLIGVAYKKSNVLDNKEFFEVNKYFEQRLKDVGAYSDKLLKEVVKKGSVQEMEEVPKEIRKVFVTAHDILPEDHIRMQATFQKYTDNAVSKTINFSNKATKENVAEAYTLSYSLGCKGVTVYRDGSREGQILNVGEKEKKEESKYTKIRKCPKETKGSVIRTRIGCGKKMFVTLSEGDNGLCEIFTTVGKSGGCTSSQMEAVSRVTSLALQAGVNPQDIIDQLKGIRCPAQGLNEEGMILSCGDCIAKTMEKYLKSKEKPEDNKEEKKVDTKETDTNTNGDCPECPECGHLLIFKEGCSACPQCGYSKCG